MTKNLASPGTRARRRFSELRQVWPPGAVRPISWPRTPAVTWRATACVLLALAVRAAAAPAAPQEAPARQQPARTDSFEEKIHLIRRAYDAGDFDLALSLSESIKDTLTFAKQLRGAAEPVQLPAACFQPTGHLPPVWSRWARGWKYYKTVGLQETEGIERVDEPVDVIAAIPIEPMTDLTREVRVARVDPRTAMLREVVSQVYGEVRRGRRRQCHIVFLGNVPARSRVVYLLFYGNPYAERPAYVTDLRVTGTGYGLSVANQHYVARLSTQTGQLERLISRRQHGLELYAGGKGHGEPPTIDWGNDYVDEGAFQKFRVRNWSECPNYEVVRGPLCVRVRRWGFPHSPVHPVFTPSRLHIDLTYVFYARKRYFLKQGTMQAIKDLHLAALRDDEWVLSGYSFTDTVWMDKHGQVHEGPVPPADAESLWGVGFFHRTSRDSFIALWLQHDSIGLNGLKHNGVPTLHYHQHGQLWSRYPLGSGNLIMPAGAAIREKNAYLLGEYPRQGAASAIERLRRRLLHPLVVRSVETPPATNAQARGRLARDGETLDTAPLKPAIWSALRRVRDEQLYKVNANIVDMGYVYDLSIHQAVAHVLVTMPHRGRGVYRYLVTQGGGHTGEGIREQVRKVHGVKGVVVDFTWYPPWTIARLSQAGYRAMGLDGAAGNKTPPGVPSRGPGSGRNRDGERFHAGQ